MRLHSVQAVVGAALAAAIVGGGCSCYDPPPSSDLRVTITRPTKARLTAADDANPSKEGFQLQVEAFAEDSEGSRDPVLTGAKLQIKKRGVELATIDIEPTGTTAVFPEQTLVADAYTISVTLSEENREGGASLEFTVLPSAVSTRPAVELVEFTADADGDLCLNGAEQPMGAPVAKVTTVRVPDGSKLRVLDANDPSQRFSSDVTVNGNAANVTLDQLPSGDARYDLAFEVEAPNGEKNKLTPGDDNDPQNTEALVALEVNKVAPVDLNITSETHISAAEDKDLDVANGVDFDLTFEVPGDVGQSKLEIAFDPAASSIGMPTIGTGVATAVVKLPNADASYTLNIKATDSCGNQGTTSATVVVDLTGPTVSFVEPVNQTVTNADPVDVVVSAPDSDGRPMTLTWRQLPDGMPTPFPGAAPVVTGGQVVTTVSLPEGEFELGATVTDNAGNTGSDFVVVTVDRTGCMVAISDPAAGSPLVINVASDADGLPTSGGQYDVKGQTDCPNTEVVLAGATPPVTAMTDSTGAFTLRLTVPHGNPLATYTFELTDPAGNVTSAAVTARADLVPPQIKSPVPTANPFRVVAAGNRYVQQGDLTYLVDKTPGGNGEIDVAFDVIDDELGGIGIVQSATVTFDSSSATQMVGVKSASLSFSNFSMPHNVAAGSFVISAVDDAGNVGSYTATADVDVIAPAAPAASATLSDARAAKLDVTWTGGGDDNALGTAAGFDVRWSTTLVAPGGITTEAAFYNEVLSHYSAKPSLFTTSPVTLTVPPLNRYWVQVRAVDELGNTSPLTPQTTPIDNLWTTVSLHNANTTPGVFYGNHILAGELNGQPGTDLVVTASGQGPGTVYIHYGGSSFGSSPQTLLPPGTAPESFGADAAIGNVGDLASENRDDLLVGSWNWSSGRGRAFLFFGQATGNLSQGDVIEFRPGPGSSQFFGQTAKIIGDVDGDGIRELAIGAYGAATNEGRVWIFKGRSKMDWMSARVLDPADGVMYVPLSAAWKELQGTPGEVNFGRRRGLVSLGNIDGVAGDEFAVPAPRNTVQKEYLYKAATVAAASSPVPASSAFQVLNPAAIINSSSANGFGVVAVGGLDFLGAQGSGLDLAVCASTSSTIYLYQDATAAGFDSASVKKISGFGGMGISLAVGDLTGDGFPDLATGENITSGGAGWVFYSRPDPVTGEQGQFDAIANSGLWQSKFAPPGAGSLVGVGTAIGDFDGDGKQDLAMADPAAGPNGTGTVTVYR